MYVCVVADKTADLNENKDRNKEKHFFNSNKRSDTYMYMYTCIYLLKLSNVLRIFAQFSLHNKTILHSKLTFLNFL